MIKTLTDEYGVVGDEAKCFKLKASNGKYLTINEEHNEIEAVSIEETIATHFAAVKLDVTKEDTDSKQASILDPAQIYLPVILQMLFSKLFKNNLHKRLFETNNIIVDVVDDDSSIIYSGSIV